MLNWGHERYVRLFVRDTTNWLMMPWQGKALLPLLMRKLDRDGALALGGHGTAGLAALVGMPEEVVEVGFKALTTGSDPPIVVNGDDLHMPNFVEAQEAVTTDALRKRRQRERERKRKAGTVTPDAGTVTPKRHAPSRGVTSVPSVPCRAVSDALDFEALYALYPKKGPGKAEGMERARKQITTPERYAKLKAAIENYAAEVKRDRTEKQFIKRFKSFMAPKVWPEYAETTETAATDAYQAQVADLLERA